MAGLVPAIHDLSLSLSRKTWMPAKTGSPPRYAAGCLCAGMTPRRDSLVSSHKVGTDFGSARTIGSAE